jgi:uncharacterized membrane protein YebE (DUF533 family)
VPRPPGRFSAENAGAHRAAFCVWRKGDTLDYPFRHGTGGPAMNVENLIGTMITGTLSAGSKRSRRAGRFLRGGGSSFLNASTLLTVGGLIWGAIETMQQGTGQAAPAPPAGHVPRPPGPLAASTPPPPLPVIGTAEAPAAAAAPAAPVPEGAAKLIRLMVSAARADGELSDAERQSILDHARTAGAEAIVAEELARPTPLTRIVEGITDAQQRADLYVLAFGIVRADEDVSGAERIYLAQLAALLGLEPAQAEALEREAGARIDETK